MVENVCSQMYVDPNRTGGFIAIFLKLENLDVNSIAEMLSMFSDFNFSLRVESHCRLVVP